MILFILMTLMPYGAAAKKKKCVFGFKEMNNRHVLSTGLFCHQCLSKA